MGQIITRCCGDTDKDNKPLDFDIGIEIKEDGETGNKNAEYSNDTIKRQDSIDNQPSTEQSVCKKTSVDEAKETTNLIDENATTSSSTSAADEANIPRRPSSTSHGDACKSIFHDLAVQIV